MIHRIDQSVGYEKHQYRIDGDREGELLIG